MTLHSIDATAHGRAAASGPVPVRFGGRAGEWFGIWIVNLLLTIVTLGIYSAWAKVRRNRYFYRNTTIGGRGFDYHATGGQILVGRLIVIGVLVAANLLLGLFPVLVVAYVAAAVVLVPWLVIRASRFAARNTSWSNVRFDFQAGYGAAFVTYVLLPVGVALTLYTTLPFLTRRIQSFTVNGHRLGNRRFALEAPIGGFYAAFAIALAFAVAAVAVLAGLFYATLPDLGSDAGEAIFGVMLASLYLGLFVAVLPAAVLYRAMVRNLVFAAATLEGGHRFASTVHPGRLLWIAASNAVVIVATLGLMLPWAQIRMARYMADHTTVTPRGSLDDFAGSIERDRSAVGDAFGDIEGFDVGIGAV